MSGKLEGRVAVITGGTQGIGFGIAKAFFDEGAKVVLGSRSQAKGDAALASLGGGEGARFKSTDVCSKADIEALLDYGVSEFGRVDILVNNAGGSDGFALVGDMSDEAWQHAIDWNLNSLFWATRKALNLMVPNGFGRIINISSVEGKVADKMAVSHYITHKHAMNGFTKAVAFEYGTTGVTSNAICPGAIETEMMKDAGPQAAAQMGITYEKFLDDFASHAAIKRLNTVEEVAAVALLLASDVGAGITGGLINVDGGTSPY